MIKIPILIILLFLALTQNIPPAPSPHCASNPIAKNFPLAFGETMTIDLSSFFTGYNLEIYLQSGQEVGYVEPQINEQSAGRYNLSGLINYDLKHKGNHWGEQFLLLRNDSQHRTIIYYGSFPNKRGFPSINDNVVVEQDQNTTCFDAEVFLNEAIIILDCTTKEQNKYRNYYYYIDIYTGKVTHKVENEMYIDFTSITKRKFLKFTDESTGYNYIIRAYFAQGVDQSNSKNTYFQLISAYDPFDLQILTIWERSLLGLSAFSIMDIQIYMGDLYVLDYYFGLYRFDIRKGQVIVPIGLYNCQYFRRFSVYSDNLDDKFVIAISNQHSVHQINWNQLYNPVFITKYSLLENTKVNQVIINEQFVIVQGSVRVVTFFQTESQLFYTWIYSRKSRVYSNIYKIIDHPSRDVFIEFERGYNYLLIIDDNGFRNFQLKKPILTLTSNETDINKSILLELAAVSKDFYNPNVQYCLQTIIIHYVSPSNMTLWDTGIDVSEDLYANYPGELIINLEKYAIGPNITFQYQSPFASKYEPEHWIQKKNITYLTRKGPAPVGRVNYLKTDVQQRYGNNTILAYYQDSQNNTYINTCVNQWFTSNITCNVQSQFKHNSGINALATAIIRSTFGTQYIYIFNLIGRTQIRMFYFSTDATFGNIIYPAGFEGKISDLTVSNQYLYVVLPTLKRIDVYNLNECDGSNCYLKFSLTADLMKSQGIQYFSPKQIITTREHPEVLFIKCLDSIIIVDVDNQNMITVLYQLSSFTTKNLKFKLAVNKEYLIIVSSPNIIEQYKFIDLYKGKITFHKNLPLYFYTIQDQFDLQFNDYGNLFYLTALDTHTLKSVIVIYRLGYPLVASLYDVINIPGQFSHDNLLLQVSGGYVDYVTVIASGVFYIFKEYQRSVMIVKDILQTCSFYLHIQNTESQQNITLVKVVLSNYPDAFSKSTAFPNPSLRFINKKIDDQFSWSDRNWFKGHILNNYYRCQDCPDKIQFRGHINKINQLDLLAQDYVRTPSGGFLLWDDIFKLYTNGSVQSVETLPKINSAYQYKCVKVVSSFDLFAISVCSNNYNQVNIYLTSYIGRKGFTLGPYRSAANRIANVQIVNQILALVDVDEFPQNMLRSGGVFLYSASLDKINNDRFEQIEYIDTNDLTAAHGWDFNKDVYIGNAHLIFSNESNQYRMFISQLKNGLFIVSFTWDSGNTQINLNSVDYIDLNKQIAKLNFHMPSDATYEAVTHIAIKQNDHFQIQTVLVTTNNYHNFQFFIIYTDSGRLMSCTLNKVYYRYGYYNTYNFVKSFNGFVAIPYVIPPLQQPMSNFSRQIIALYDSSDYSGDSAKGFSQRYIIAGQILNNVTRTTFDFNITYNRNTRENITGLVLIDPYNKVVRENHISKNLTLVANDPNFKSQNLFIWPYSDFHRELYQFKLIGVPDNSLKSWQIFLIVLGSVAFVSLSAVLAFYGYKKYKLFKKKTFLLEEDQYTDEERKQQQLQQQKYQRLQVNQSIEVAEEEQQKNQKQTENKQSTNIEETEHIQKQNQENQLRNQEQRIDNPQQVKQQPQQQELVMPPKQNNDIEAQ